MESTAQRRPAMRSPALSSSPDRMRSASKQSHRPGSSSSDASASSNLTSLSVARRSPYNPQLPSFVSHNNHSSVSLASSTRPSGQYISHDGTVRKTSPLAPPTELQRHRPRQHSQGFFEPSMPSASLASQSILHDHSNMPLTASQIAAQAAMHHLAEQSHLRKRSSTVPFPQDQIGQDGRRGSKSSPPPTQTQHQISSPIDQQYRNGLVGTSAAATAANAAFPRSFVTIPTPVATEEKESKKGLKRFRPKHIGISREKEKEPKDKPLPSPNKLSKAVNASNASLADSLSSNNSSMYSLANPSLATIIQSGEKDKPYRQGLRQKLKLKDKDDHHALPLSSASSNSRPTDVHNPQSLYSFAPSSPNPGSSFAKSVSALDLRHGGRALREKKKEEKAQANANTLEQVYSRRESETSEWPSLQAVGTSLTNTSTHTFTPYSSDLRDTLAGFGLNNMTPDDAWDFLKAKLLAIFEGEDLRIAVEDLNRLVIIHIQRCVQKRDPSIIVGDLDDLLKTGFLSLSHTLRNIPDERLVPHLVGIWKRGFGSILPFMQAVFLPLDQEFKGRGSVLTTPQLAADFWGGLPNADTGSQFSSSPSVGDGSDGIVAAGDELEIRRILLISFRDTIILPRFDVLKATFSRLSLESINATLTHIETTGRDRGNSGGSDRPGTSQSLDPLYSSYGSQTSTLLGTASSGARSRATSNLSNTSNPAQDVAFQSFSSPPAARAGDTSSAQVTETVGRILQCLSVICSIQSGDDAQSRMEELNKQLKLNWLGRGRTGRNRKGFVGSRVRPRRSIGSTIRANDRDGSPTPTPTRQGTVSRQGDEASIRAG